MNRSYYLIIILLLICSATADAQYTRYTVQLKDKKGSAYSISQPAAFLSAKAIQRRTRQDIAINSNDLPVSKLYLDSIANIDGITIINTSRWLNNVMVQVADSGAMAKVTSLPFVRRVIPVAMHPQTNRSVSISKNIAGEKPVTPTVPAASSFRLNANNAVLEDTLRYGLNYPQVHIHEGEYLHQRGFRGQGITIAVLDAGFRSYQSNPAFDSLRANAQILGEYDFVYNEEEVNNDDAHGANCLSILAANIPGQMVGTAPKANYYLFKSEDVTSEKPAEEQYWAVAAERADSAGADMISSSLGYSIFDDTSLSITYPQRDGKSSPITFAANMAFKKGMIVTNSSGNSGEFTNDYKYVICPADGDNVLAIGAVDTDGQIAGFSCGGPTGAGKLKPNLVSVGFNTVFTNIHGVVSTGSGTSYSNPNLAGLIACLWQAFNDMTNADIVDALQQSADRYANPNQRYGYGIPNMRLAYQILEAKRKQRVGLGLKKAFITAYPVPFRQSFILYMKAPSTGTAMLRILDANGLLIYTRTVSVQQGVYYHIYMNPNISSSGLYYLQYDDGKNKTILKLVRM